MTIPEGFVQVTHNFGGLSAPNGAAVVYGCQSDPEFTSPESAAEIMHNNWQEWIMPVLALELALLTTLVKFGPDETGATGEYSESVSGGDTGNAASPAVSYLVTKRTAIGGRRARGRFYLPGVTEASVSQGGVVLGAKVTALNSAFEDWLDDLDGIGIHIFLLHEPATVWDLVHGQPRRVPTGDPPPAPSVVTSCIASTVAATQRRRQRR